MTTRDEIRHILVKCVPLFKISQTVAWKIITFSGVCEFGLQIKKNTLFSRKWVRAWMSRAAGPGTISYQPCTHGMVPDSKIHGANMGPIWDQQDRGGPHVGPMNFAIWGRIQYHTVKTVLGDQLLSPPLERHFVSICTAECMRHCVNCVWFQLVPPSTCPRSRTPLKE